MELVLAESNDPTRREGTADGTAGITMGALAMKAAGLLVGLLVPDDAPE